MTIAFSQNFIAIRGVRLVVIENNCKALLPSPFAEGKEGGIGTFIQFFKVSPCKRGDEVFGRKQGKGFPFSGDGPLNCLAQIVEEGRRVFITGVYLVPQARNSSGLEITADQSSLSAARRTRDPDHRLSSHAVEQGKQPSSKKNFRDDGAGALTHKNLRLPRGDPPHFDSCPQNLYFEPFYRFPAKESNGKEKRGFFLKGGA